MSYHFSKMLSCKFPVAVEKVITGLQQEGFGVITTIDIQETFRKKMDLEFRKYIILGACNPSLAFRAITAEDKIGTMMPCNIIIQEHAGGKVEVSAIDPEASMMAVKNESLTVIIREVGVSLKKVLDNL